MISCTAIGTMGRLGNWMFQFASCLGLSRTLGFELRLPEGNSLRGAFDMPDSLFLPASELSLGFSYKERFPGFDPGCLKVADGTDIRGYLQSPRYFSHVSDELAGALRFRPDVSSRCDEAWAGLGALRSRGQTVSVHFRRGDYVGNPTHPVCGHEYYEQALALFPGCVFVVFSDDPEWCRQNLHGDDFSVVSTGSDLVDMALMSRCDHHVIANSTFSWWGAWLARGAGRVVAPARWFGNKRRGFVRFSDIYCEGWTVI